MQINKKNYIKISREKKERTLLNRNGAKSRNETIKLRQRISNAASRKLAAEGGGCDHEVTGMLRFRKETERNERKGKKERGKKKKIGKKVEERLLPYFPFQSLDGFAMAVAADGRFLYISETVSIYLGLSQVSV